MITATSTGCILMVRAQPGAKRNAILGCHADALKVAVTAPPDRGRANEAIIELLSESLDVSRSSIELIQGQTSRQKRFAILGLTPDEVLARLKLPS